MNKKRSVDQEELAQLGFPQRDIDAAVNMEKLGLFRMEPSADLVERTIQRCIPLLQTVDAASQPSLTPLMDSSDILHGCMALLKDIPPGLRASSEWSEMSLVQGLPQACLSTAGFARSRRDRPFLMVDNHNVVEPAWWGRDTGFRAFWNSCQIVNRLAAEYGVPRAACVVVLRPGLVDYSKEDLAMIDDLVRRGTSDIWWVSYERAGDFKGVDLIVFGEERILKLNQRPVSPVEALGAFQETANQDVARRLRAAIKCLANSATNIRMDGNLSASAADKVGTVDGIRSLMSAVISGEVAVVR